VRLARGQAAPPVGNVRVLGHYPPVPSDRALTRSIASAPGASLVIRAPGARSSQLFMCFWRKLSVRAQAIFAASAR